MSVKVISQGRIRYGLYESDEMPRRCGRCNSTDSRTADTWETGGMRKRKRICTCGHVFVTQTIIDDIPKTPLVKPINTALQMT